MDFYRLVFLASGASSIRHQQFLLAGTGKSADLLAGGATATHLVSRIAVNSHVMICMPVQRGVFVDVCTRSQVRRSSIWLQLTCMMAGKVIQPLLWKVKPASPPGFHVTSADGWNEMVHTRRGSHLCHFHVPAGIAESCFTKHDGMHVLTLLFLNASSYS